MRGQCLGAGGLLEGSQAHSPLREKPGVKINSRSETVEQMSLGRRELVVAVGGMSVSHGRHCCGGLQFRTMVGLCVHLRGSFYKYTRKLFNLVTYFICILVGFF